MRPADIYPGWKMTVKQHGLYFRLLAAAFEALGAVTSKDKERLRHDAHITAFGLPYKSATDINRTKEFDAIASEFKRLASIIERDDPARQRTIFVAKQRLAALRELTSATYLATLLKERFKILRQQRTIEDLPPKQLSELISTVNNRIRMLSGSRRGAESAETADDNIPF